MCHVQNSLCETCCDSLHRTSYDGRLNSALKGSRSTSLDHGTSVHHEIAPNIPKLAASKLNAASERVLLANAIYLQPVSAFSKIVFLKK